MRLWFFHLWHELYLYNSYVPQCKPSGPKCTLAWTTLRLSSHKKRCIRKTIKHLLTFLGNMYFGERKLTGSGLLQLTSVWVRVAQMFEPLYDYFVRAIICQPASTGTTRLLAILPLNLSPAQILNEPKFEIQAQPKTSWFTPWTP